MTADLVGWHDEHLLDHRRRLRTSMFVSLAIHGIVLAIFAASPPNPVAPTPEYLSVDLVAAAPVARPAAPVPAPSAPAPAPAPEAAPSPPPPVAPAPPIAAAPVQVLPEETPGKIREAPKPPPAPPKVVAKVEPKPAPPPRRRREKAVSYEDAMAALADELGVDDSAPLVEAPTPAAETTSVETGGTASKGLEVSPEQLAWDRQVTQQISKRFVNIPRYRGRGLVTQVEVDVRADGSLGGSARLIRTSGDLDFDRAATSAIQLAAPLPPPPEPGKRRLNLTSEAR